MPRPDAFCLGVVFVREEISMENAPARQSFAVKSTFNMKDITSGVLMIAIAATGIYVNLDYELGSAGRMGPGYMPFLIFSLLGIFGFATAIIGMFNGPEKLESIAWRELGLILASLTLFGVLLNHVGLAVSVLLLVGVSSLADKTQTLKGAMCLAIALVALCWLVFIYALNMSVPFAPPFLSSI